VNQKRKKGAITLGIFSAFKKKKDEFSQDPSFDMPQDNQFPDQQGFAPPMDQGMESQDPFPAQQNYQNYPQQAQPQGLSPEQMGFERVQPGQQQNYSQQGSSQNITDINIGKDFELLNAKLDSIKAELDAISQRIKRIERMHESESLGKKDPWY
jgi:hypothetical protein